MADVARATPQWAAETRSFSNLKKGEGHDDVDGQGDGSGGG
ncbi:MAG: hypothetical protein HW383_490 [Candidatus Magasanikbacteria bacterium]|nr:hypothetical protein [Candidatus Magasanikbacteria bacterium]